MPYFREEDTKRKTNSWSDEAHTIDKLDQNAATIELRQRLDLILNSDHWDKKRSKEDNERLNWLATTGGHEA